jgi:hypothetical protein
MSLIPQDLHEWHVERECIRDELIGQPGLEHLPQTEDELFSLILVGVIPRPRFAWSRSHRGLSRP